jgi:spore maturation protein SpmA
VNRIFVAFIVTAFAAAFGAQLAWIPALEQYDGIVAPMQSLQDGAMGAAKVSVTLAISLIGGMALFLGLVKVAEDGGGLTILAKLIRPLMVRLFPEVPPNHPAMGAMILNMSANAMGLGNAATPFGIRAMKELDKLNKSKGTASNSMALFLAINTSSVTILPTGVIVMRTELGSQDPSGILATTLFATLCSTTVAVLGCKLWQRFSKAPEPDPEADVPEEDESEAIEGADEAYPLWVTGLAMTTLVSVIPLTILYGERISVWVVPTLIVGFVGFGWIRGVAVYESFVKGAKEGFDIAVLIIPYLVAILVSIGMLRASGALGAFVRFVSPLTEMVGLPAEALPMAILRPLSGSGAMGVMLDTMKESGPDSYVGYLVSTFQGSTETTFYVLAVYFGAVGVKRIRHTLVAALTADIVGIMAAVAICSLLYGAL